MNPPEREKYVVGSLGKVASKNIINFAEKLLAKELPKKTAQRRKAIKDEAEAEDIIINEINSNPYALDEMPISILENLSTKNKAKIGLADEYSAYIAENTSGMIKDMSPKEVAENILVFDDDDIFEYMSTLNAKDLREFKNNLSDDDLEVFGDYMSELGPRKTKSNGGKSIMNPPELEELYYDEFNFISGKTGKLDEEALAKASGLDPKDPKAVSQSRKFLSELKNVENLLLSHHSKTDKKRGEEKEFKKLSAKAKDSIGVLNFNNIEREVLEYLKDKKRQGKADGGNLEETTMSLEAKIAAADSNKRQRLLQLKRNAEARLRAENMEPTADKIEAMAQRMEQEEMQRRMEEAAEKFKRQPLANGGKFPDLTGDGKVTQADVLKGRGVFNEGGSMLIPPEGMPVDTYPNIPADEMDEALASQLPDDEMEDDYIDYIMDEALSGSDQDYLVEALQKDDRLADILDQVILTASEFSGAGEVKGPGTGVSDSIPARLSDGEFVFTRKATDQIGADNLQRMMDDAERAYDGGYQMKAIGGYMQEDPEKQDSPLSKTDEEIKKLMMGANKMPSLR